MIISSLVVSEKKKVETNTLGPTSPRAFSRSRNYTSVAPNPHPIPWATDSCCRIMIYS
jgi:hypothetical protein